MNVLVTGATGFLGRHLCAALVERGDAVRAFVRPGTDAGALEALGLKHHQDVVVHKDSPSLRGQLKHVRHLIKVTPVKEEEK